MENKLKSFLEELTELSGKYELFIVSDCEMELEDSHYDKAAFDLKFDEDTGFYIANRVE